MTLLIHDRMSMNSALHCTKTVFLIAEAEKYAALTHIFEHRLEFWMWFLLKKKKRTNFSENFWNWNLEWKKASVVQCYVQCSNGVNISITFYLKYYHGYFCSATRHQVYIHKDIIFISHYVGPIFGRSLPFRVTM